jgi:hypothetical protein
MCTPAPRPFHDDRRRRPAAELATATASVTIRGDIPATRPRWRPFATLAVAVAAWHGCGREAPPADGRCQRAAAELPPRTARAVDVIFDVGGVGFVGAVDIVPSASGSIVILTTPGAYSIAADGAIESFATYPATAALGMRLLQVAVGDTDHGAVFDVSEMGASDTRFCVLDQAGAVDEQRCTILSTGRFFPKATYDGLDYRVYAVRSGTVRRWILDRSAVVVSDEELWSSGFDNAVVAARASGDRELVVNVGFVEGCSTVMLHENDPAGHTAENLAPTGYANKQVMVGGLGRDRLAIVHQVACGTVDVLSRCVRDDDILTFLSTYHDGRMTLAPTIIPLPGFADAQPVFFDGSRIVVPHQLSLRDLALSRYDADGTLDLSLLHLPLAYLDGEAHAITAGAAIGPDDYVIVYDMNGPRGFETRVARFRIR